MASGVPKGWVLDYQISRGGGGGGGNGDIRVSTFSRGGGVERENSTVPPSCMKLSCVKCDDHMTA